jgi:hypothetical protein
VGDGLAYCRSEENAKAPTCRANIPLQIWWEKVIGGAMRYLMLGFFFLLTGSIAGQVEHAPTIAQCQADQRLWLSKIEENPKQLPSFTVLNKWKNEMNDCQSVDPSNQLKYYNTLSEIGSVRQVLERG